MTFRALQRPSLQSHGAVRSLSWGQQAIARAKPSVPLAAPAMRLGRTRGFWNEPLAENTGSTARDHLANERTFLAWARTGLGFVGSGLAFFYASTENPKKVKQIRSSNILPATGLLVGNGLLFLGFAMVRYFAAMRHLRDGKFPINSRGVTFMIVSTGVTSLLSLYLIVHDRLQRGDDEIIHELGLDVPQQVVKQLTAHWQNPGSKQDAAGASSLDASTPASTMECNGACDS